VDPFSCKIPEGFKKPIKRPSSHEIDIFECFDIDLMFWDCLGSLERPWIGFLVQQRKAHFSPFYPFTQFSYGSLRRTIRELLRTPLKTFGYERVLKRNKLKEKGLGAISPKKV